MLGPGHYHILLRALERAGFSVAAIHLKGHGMNLIGRGRYTLFSFEELLEQGLTAESWLKNNRDAPLAICGHSQGAILALAHAARSSNLAAVFAIGAVLPQMSEAIELTRFRPFRKYRAALLKMLTALAHFMPFLPIPLPFYLEPLRILAGKKIPVFTGRERGRLCYPLSFLVSLFSVCIPEKIKCPCWIFSASDDALFTKDIVEATARRLDAPRLRLVLLERGGHLAPLNPDLADFMARTMAAECAGMNIPLKLFKDGS